MLCRIAVLNIVFAQIRNGFLSDEQSNHEPNKKRRSDGIDAYHIAKEQVQDGGEEEPEAGEYDSGCASEGTCACS